MQQLKISYMDCVEFKNSLKKVKGTRNHKIKESYGVYDGYKYYRKNKPKDPKYILSESQYFTIIRLINKLFVESFLLGEDITLPCRMGRIELRKYSSSISLVNGKVKTNLPIDWDRTLSLWYEDTESRNSKTLLRKEEKEIYRIVYNKASANYNNKSLYQFKANRALKLKIKEAIQSNSIDAFKFN